MFRRPCLVPAGPAAGAGRTPFRGCPERSGAVFGRAERWVTPPNVLLVATEAAGTIVGFAAAHPADGELYLLFVHPDSAGRGVGRRLLDAAHAALRAAGCGSAFLYTHERNERALAVYRAAGYRPDGPDRESDFRGTPIRELRLVRPL